MPVRKTPKICTAAEKAFVHAVVNGIAYTQAYKAAFPESEKYSVQTLRNKASRLMATERVAEEYARAKALLEEKAQKSLAQGFQEQFDVTKDWIRSRIIEVAERCLQNKPVLDARGEPVLTSTKDGDLAAAYAFDPKGAMAALKALGTEKGMFVEKKEVRIGPLSSKSDEDVDGELKRALDELNEITGEQLTLADVRKLADGSPLH